DVTVYSTSSYVVYSYYTYNLKLKNLKLLCSSSYGLYMYYAQGWRVENCLIRATSYCVYASSGCNYDSFIGNDLKGGSYTMYLYNSSYAYGHYLANNFIYGWSTYGIYAYYGYYWKFLYNTIIGPGSYGVYAYYQNGDTWKNNILQANTYAVYRYSGSTVPAYSNYNAFWINGGTTSSPVIYSSTYGAQTLAQWQSSSGRDGNSIQQNPQTGGVMNPHLRSSSPCIN
ncbi:MAG: right-handed parallel beta-helix repeat-containing protein, partial [candidate division WOR-3 bacterium]